MKVYATFVLLILQIYCLECQTIRDIKISLIIDDEKLNLEGYLTKEDKMIITKKEIDSYKYLEWFSIGIPVIIESERSKLDKSKSFFHFTSEYIYTSIQMLTSEQKQSIVEDIKINHNIIVRENQIENFKLSKFKCKMRLYGENEDENSELSGEVQSFKSYPLKLEFKVGNTSAEQKWLKKSLSESKEDIEMFCDISSNKYRFEKKNYKLGIKTSCLLGGSLNCKNDRKCLKTGSCSECEYFVSILKKYISKKYEILASVKGCNNTGSLLCVNDGECLPNGTCKCKTGFGGITCQECKYF
jgi:hypothetical protein